MTKTQFPAWQPIESAPKDHTEIIVAVSCGDDVVVGEAYYNDDGTEDGWWWANTDWGDYTAERIETTWPPGPTHWMPMPDQPEISE